MTSFLLQGTVLWQANKISTLSCGYLEKDIQDIQDIKKTQAITIERLPIYLKK